VAHRRRRRSSARLLHCWRALFCVAAARAAHALQSRAPARQSSGGERAGARRAITRGGAAHALSSRLALVLRSTSDSHPPSCTRRLSRSRAAQNRRNTPGRIELMKYNKYLRRHTLHREIKK
jgi:ribosomal protein L33